MITNQIYLFFIFVLNGIIIALLFDFFRILRRSFKIKDITTYFQDFLFWVLTGLILLYSICIFNNGEIRLFMLLGVIIGAILYILLVSKYVIKINVEIIKFFKKLFNKIFNILILPIKCIKNFIKKIFFKPISFFIINIRKFSTKFSNNIHINIKNLKNNKKDVKN